MYKSDCKKCSKKRRGSKCKSCDYKSSFIGKAQVMSVNRDKIKGDILFMKMKPGKVLVKAHFKGLKPNQSFGFHVHEFGTCANKALLAGAHWNPMNNKHGGSYGEDRHMGDLGNLNSDNKGQALYTNIIPGRMGKFLGRSVIIHAKADDMKSQPSGNSGERIACGVVVASMPEEMNISTEDYKGMMKRAMMNKMMMRQGEVLDKAMMDKMMKKMDMMMENMASKNPMKAQKAMMDKMMEMKGQKIDKAMTDKMMEMMDRMMEEEIMMDKTMMKDKTMMDKSGKMMGEDKEIQKASTGSLKTP